MGCRSVLERSELDIQIPHALRVRLNEPLARRNLAPHQHFKRAVGFRRVFRTDS